MESEREMFKLLVIKNGEEKIYSLSLGEEEYEIVRTALGFYLDRYWSNSGQTKLATEMMNEIVRVQKIDF